MRKKCKYHDLGGLSFSVSRELNKDDIGSVLVRKPRHHKSNISADNKIYAQKTTCHEGCRSKIILQTD